MKAIEVKVPITLVSWANKSEHWAVRSKRNKFQCKLVRMLLSPKLASVELPVNVQLIRRSAKKIDSDNLVIAFKHIRDCVASMLNPKTVSYQRNGKTIKNSGFCDDDPRISWTYCQEMATCPSFEGNSSITIIISGDKNAKSDQLESPNNARSEPERKSEKSKTNPKRITKKA